jgi:ribosome-dependent ATPase
MAAIFGTAILTLIPAVQYSGVITPVDSMTGAGAVIGRIFPTTFFVTTARGTFSKGLGLADLGAQYIPMALAFILLIAASSALLRKQAR